MIDFGRGDTEPEDWWFADLTNITNAANVSAIGIYCRAEVFTDGSIDDNASL